LRVGLLLWQRNGWILRDSLLLRVLLIALELLGVLSIGRVLLALISLLMRWILISAGGRRFAQLLAHGFLQLMPRWLRA
jgi:hypothetical protein